MGTLLKIGPFRIEIRTREHGVPHFHIVGPSGQASVAIKDFKVLAVKGIHAKDIRRICHFLEDHRQMMMEVWNENQKD